MIRRLVSARLLVLAPTLAIALAGCGPSAAPAVPSAAATPSDGRPTGSPGASTPAGATPDAGGPPVSPSPIDGAPAPTDVSAPPTGEPPAGLAWQLVDGTPFTSVDTIADAAALGSVIVAVGSSEGDSGGRAAAWYSLDGHEWQPADSVSGADDASIDAVAAGPGGLVAVGFDYSGEEALVPAAWQSADGRSWTRVSDADLARGQMAAVALTAQGYLALGADFDEGSALAWTSADGLDWSAASIVAGLGAEAAITGLAAAGSRLIAFGSSSDGAAQVWHSADGFDWQPADGFVPGSDSAVNDIAVGANGLVAVGADYLEESTRPLAWTSGDGTTWRPQSLELHGEMLGVAAVESGYLAVGSLPERNELDFAAAAWSSADGVSWEALPEAPSFDYARMFELVAAASGVVVIGEKSLDAAGEEMAPAVWIRVAQQEGQR